jgi:integrase
MAARTTPYSRARRAGRPGTATIGNPGRAGERYTNLSYGQAVKRAVERANQDQAEHAAEFGPNLPPIPHWHPNQLRHAHGTSVRRQYGLEAAQVALGHARANITEVYAERDLGLAIRVAGELG